MKLSLSKKISIALFIAFIVSIVYASFFSYMLYERLYVKNIENEMLETGKRLAYDYRGGKVEDSFINDIHSFGRKSKFEIFTVRNPRELSMCLPFEVDYHALIDGDEREELLRGNPVYKKGYVERLDREVISVVIPLLDEKRLEGIIYLYYPLAYLSEMTFNYSIYWLAGAGIFLLSALTIGHKWIRHAIKPLKEMKHAAQQVSEGNLSVRVGNYHDDEIGQLARTFNAMADSIQQEDEHRKDFLANVSHELRTPLSYIKGYLEAIQSGVAEKKDEEKYRQIILRESKRMERLIDDLLDLAKLDSKEFSLQKTPIPLAQVIEESLERVKHRMNDKGIRLHSELDYEMIVEADEERLTQMMLNLLDNAINYTENGGTITVTLEKGKKGIALIEIKDNGPGIPKEDLAKVTERFYRVQKARTRSEGGTGLGLSIVARLVKLHDGKLTINSETGKGTTVTVMLPLI